jgi:hypothetical protein
MKTTPEIRSMNAVELAVRRVSDRLKGRTPWDMAVTDALDELADELSRMSADAFQAINDFSAETDQYSMQ